MSQTVTIDSGSVVIDVAAPTTQVVTIGSDITTPASISRDDALTIVKVEPTSVNGYLQLPSDSEIGDVFEIYPSATGTNFSDDWGIGSFGRVFLLASSGEFFLSGHYRNNNSMLEIPCRIRKLASDQWGVLD